MNEDLEILDNGNRRKAGSKTFQLVLFIFACIGFLVKLIYSIYSYGELSRLNIHGADFSKLINTMKLVTIGIFLHSILLFSGALLLFLRRKAGIWLYLAAHLIFFVAVLYSGMLGGPYRLNRMSLLELLVFAIYFIVPAAFIAMNLINRRYWLSRNQL